MTKNASTEMESTIDIWSTSDLGIIMLLVAVIAATLYNFLFTVGWIQFIDRSIIIVPAIIGLMLHLNFYFKRTALKIVTATRPIVKRMTVNNNVTTSFALKRFIAALTIISFTVKKLYSTGVAAINFAFKKEDISFHIHAILASIYIYVLMGLSYNCRTIEAAYLSLMILATSFDHLNIAGGFICLAIIFVGIIIETLGLLLGTNIYYNNPATIIAVGFVVLIFCFSFLNDLHSHEIVYTAVILSIGTFTYDLVSSFVDMPDFVSRLLVYLFLTVSFLHFAANNHFIYYYYLRIHEYYGK